MVTGRALSPSEQLERPAPHRPSALSLVAAIVLALAGAGAMIASDVLDRAAHQQARASIDSDVDRLVGAFDQAARSARVKADGMATAPILRAAIETDSATMLDVLTNEYVFTPAKGESVEVFQARDRESVSLARLPASAPAMQPLKAGATRVNLVGDTTLIEASAPIATAKSASAGSVVIATPVDLSPVKHSLEQHATAATLTGFDQPIDVVPARNGRLDNPLEIALPSTGDWNPAGTKLIVAPIISETGLEWIPAARTGAFAAAALLFVVYVIGWVRSGARSQATT